MPEYLAPGVYVEETSFRSKSIEGVGTSTAGFVGPALFGPISGQPELLTSFADFERIYGGMYDLDFADQSLPTNYLAHGVRAFFEEGGQRLYVTRVFQFPSGVLEVDTDGIPQESYAIWTAPSSPPESALRFVARFPGAAGNMQVQLTVRVGANALIGNPPGGSGPLLTRVQSFDIVHVGTPQPGSPPGGASPGFNVFGSSTDGLYVTHWNTLHRLWELRDGTGGNPLLLSGLSQGVLVRPVTILVEVARPNISTQGIPGFDIPVSLGEFNFDGRTPNGLLNAFTRRPSTRLQALTSPFSIELGDVSGIDPDLLALEIARGLLGHDVINTLLSNTAKPADRRRIITLQGGNDGNLPWPTDYAGDQPDFNDFIGDPLQMDKRGLAAFESVEDISIVAAPGYSAQANQDSVLTIHGALIAHCEKMRYRIAVLDTPPNRLVSDALDFRNQTSSTYAALYYPWITIVDPLTDNRLNLPPSGFVAGIFARNDIEHAVFKAPANEVVHLAIDFEQRLNKAQQEVLNPEGVNCFRYFPGYGFLLWGARTIGEDPEWKYVNIRRYFAYLEHSIDRGTQWVVFENNSKRLWDNVRHTVEDFLLNEWKMGALMGDKPEQAYFVRCDLTTMTQNDLDNGRLVCLIGVAAVKPAEFVIFRIGQWTATANG